MQLPVELQPQVCVAVIEGLLVDSEAEPVDGPLFEPELGFEILASWGAVLGLDFESDIFVVFVVKRLRCVCV